VLVARPFNALRGQAPRRGFGAAAKVEGCDRDVQVEGVLFRLVSVDVTKLDRLPEATRKDLVDLLEHADDIGSAALPQTLSYLRNRLAHACLGTEELAGFAADPFERLGGESAYVSYGVVDALEAQGLLDACDLPLALVLWTVTGVKWVDMWSVRRRLHPQAGSFFGAMPASPRRQAEAEAAFFQFQGQLSGLFLSSRSNFSLASIQVRDYFRYLPPAGLVPIRFEAARGFEFLNFITGLTVRDREVFQALSFPDRFFIEGARLESLFRDALAYPPIDVLGEELIWFYLVRQNIQAIDAASADPAASRPVAYTVFTNGHMPYLGNAHFDLSRWGYSNFTLPAP
jgi:hypothetical protein